MDASKIIDQKIASLHDWRGERMKSIRDVVRQVDPAITEEWKWMGTPVWNLDGILCLANAHKNVVKMTFPKGAKLPDPKKVFNAGLNGNRWRAIDWSEGDPLNVEGLKGLVRAAIALNREKPAARKAGGAASVTAKTRGAKTMPAAKAKRAAKAPAAKTKIASNSKPVATKKAAPKSAAKKKPTAKKN